MSGNIDVQKISIVWLDNSSIDSEDKVYIEKRLRLIDENPQIFNEQCDCENYIKSQCENARIILIVNGTLGKVIVPGIVQLSQIEAIYVFCMNVELHKQWADTFEKIKGVFTDFTLLEKQIQSNPILLKRTTHSIISTASTTNSLETEELTTTPTNTQECTASPQTEAPTTSTQIEVSTEPAHTDEPTNVQSQSGPVPNQFLYELDILYMISDICFNYLSLMKLSASDMDDFYSLCRHALQGNSELLVILHEMQENYSANGAISWLYRHPFFYGYLDNIFKAACIDAMLPCRVFIQDIYKQLEQHKCTSTIQVYRYEDISNEICQHLKTLDGTIITMKYFLLTNSVCETALLRMRDLSSTGDCKRVLFTIDADPQIKNVKLFAKIGSLSNCNNLTDVLFMIGSCFKITEIQDEKDGIINIKMTLCGTDDTNQLSTMFDKIKSQYISANREIDITGYGLLLFDIGTSIGHHAICCRGEDYVRSYHAKLSNDHSDQLSCYDALAHICYAKGDFNSSLDSYNKSLEIRQKTLSGNDPNLVENYGNIVKLHLQKRDFKQALEYLMKIVRIWKESNGEHCIDLIPYYAHIAGIYEDEQNFMEALSFYSQVEIISVKHGIDTNINYSLICNNLGNIRTRLSHYHLALGYYQTSLEIKLKHLTLLNPVVAQTYTNIGLAYKYMNNIQQARTNLEQAAEIYRQVQSPDNSKVIEIEKLIQDLPS